MLFNLMSWATLLFTLTATASVIRSNPTLHDIWQFPLGTWVENLAVRTNGQLLVTLLSQPELYHVDPFQKTAPTLIHSFPNASGLLGIAEIEDDVFAVVAGNWSTTTLATTPRS
jgi:hypothetical protein